MGEYFRSWVFIPQKPKKRAYEQSPKEVQKWLEEEHPTIKADAKCEGAEIHWATETDDSFHFYTSDTDACGYGLFDPQWIFYGRQKIESRANRYTFVWRKSVEKNKRKPEEKIRRILEQVEEDIAQDNHPDDAPPPIDAEELKRRVAEINRENRTKEELKAIKTIEEKHLPKLQEYKQKLQVLDGRVSYSKTDPDATLWGWKTTIWWTDN